VLKEFKDFALKGNLIEIAVGLVMALAFVAVIGALVTEVLMPIVGIIFGEPNFNQVMILEINDSQIKFGAFIQAIVVFLMIAFAVFFFVVKPYEAIKARQASGEEEAPAPAEDIVLLTEIRDSLKR
jgi:large conductance mechanosensitive channel